jgi:hypothetical protein
MVGMLLVLVAAERVECRRLGEVSIRFEKDNLLIEQLKSVYETMFSPYPPSIALVLQGDNVLNGGGGIEQRWTTRIMSKKPGS